MKRTTTGIYFDLALIYHDLNSRFFSKEIKASLRWGNRRLVAQAKRSIRLGSYHSHKQAIIINPCLDQAIVPKICVERILFHEMAHQKFPISKNSQGRNIIHCDDFYDFERKYPFLCEADMWIKANLYRLLQH